MTNYNELRDGQEFYANGYKKGYEDAKKEFERPQGEWVLQTYERFDNGNELYKYYCDKCGYREEHAYSDSKLSNFCPNCGADMRKGEEE